MKQEKSDNLAVLVVWEPILPSDWGRPTRLVLDRLSDRRVIQFWDKDHLIAQELSAQLHTKEPNCCRHSGTLWDLVALYGKGTNWNGPEPSFIDGPVYKIEAELQSQTSKLLQAQQTTFVRGKSSVSLAFTFATPQTSSRTNPSQVMVPKTVASRLLCSGRLIGGSSDLQDIPDFRPWVPLSGWFVRKGASNASPPQSVIFPQTTMYPTMGAIIDLLSDTDSSPARTTQNCNNDTAACNDHFKCRAKQ